MEPIHIQRHELRTLLRIATEARDPRWALEPWIRELAQKCDLDLSRVDRQNKAA
jgi:hypothetical protein